MTNKIASVYVATPSYDGKFSAQYVKSVTEYAAWGEIDYYLGHVIGESLLSRARSTLLSDFYSKLDNFTHILWLDSDVYIPYYGLKKMIERDVDAISAAVPVKTDITNYGIKIVGGKIEEKIDPTLYKMSEAGTCGLLLKTKVIKSLVKYAEINNMQFLETYANGNQIILCDLFRVGMNREGVFISEDIFFSSIIAALNYNIYLESSFYTEHSNSQHFTWAYNQAEINPGILDFGSPVPVPENQKDKFFIPSCYGVI